MMLPIGNKASSEPVKATHVSGFTLIELILVMAIMLIVMAVSGPSLSHFFRGRNLDVECRRFLSLTIYGQSRAISEGVPMVLWIDQEEGMYGLHADTSFVKEDERKVEYELARDLEIEILAGDTSSNRFMSVSESGTTGAEIRFQPDGLLGPASVERVIIHNGEREEAWIGRTRNRLRYEIQTNIIRLEVQQPQ